MSKTLILRIIYFVWEKLGGCCVSVRCPAKLNKYNKIKKVKITAKREDNFIIIYNVLGRENCN